MPSDADLQDLLKHEQFMAEVLRLRQTEKPKAWWETAGVVPAVMAVLTVLVTSVTGYLSQRGLKETEALLTSVRERGQLEREAAKRASSAIAEMLKANDERLRLAHGDFDSLAVDKRDEIAEGTNKLQERWRLEREDLDMDLFLVFAPSSGVFDSWQGARRAIEVETECVENAYAAAQKRRAPEDVCRTFADATAKAVASLREHIRGDYDQLTATK